MIVPPDDLLRFLCGDAVLACSAEQFHAMQGLAVSALDERTPLGNELLEVHAALVCPQLVVVVPEPVVHRLGICLPLPVPPAPRSQMCGVAVPRLGRDENLIVRPAVLLEIDE